MTSNKTAIQAQLEIEALQVQLVTERRIARDGIEHVAALVRAVRGGIGGASDDALRAARAAADWLMTVDVRGTGR